MQLTLSYVLLVDELKRIRVVLSLPFCDFCLCSQRSPNPFTKCSLVLQVMGWNLGGFIDQLATSALQQRMISIYVQRVVRDLFGPAKYDDNVSNAIPFN